MEKEKRLVQPTNTRALGILNKETAEEVVDKGLADDERLLTEVFKIFNKEFYDGKLLEPVIHISHAVKEEIGIKITDSEEWVKHDKGKSEKCKGLYFSDKILKYGVVSEMGMENAYIMLAVGMITLYDKEMRDAYKYGVDIRSDEEKAQDRKKGGKTNKEKKSYKGMVTRGGYYYTKEFAKECERIGLIAIPDEDKDGKYLLSAGEIFIEVLKKYDLLNRRFICAKYQQMEEQQNGLIVRRALLEEKKSSVRTYQCPKCKLNVRGTKSGLKIKCCSDEHKGEEFFMEEIKREKSKKQNEVEEQKVKENKHEKSGTSTENKEEKVLVIEDKQ